jgi:hypothetical protein
MSNIKKKQEQIDDLNNRLSSQGDNNKKNILKEKIAMAKISLKNLIHEENKILDETPSNQTKQKYSRKLSIKNAKIGPLGGKRKTKRRTLKKHRKTKSKK